MRGATGGQHTNSIHLLFQSTHPMRGATTVTAAGNTVLSISIHAPHEGCDSWKMPLEVPGEFQSTHPMRGATIDYDDLQKIRRFQSTHPMRGATAALSHPLRRCRISIHAPHEGCDGKNLIRLSCQKKFQSTHPMRGATGNSARRRGKS